MSAVVEYQPVKSLIHDLHPLTKMLGASAILILSLIYSNPVFLAAIYGSVLIVAWIAGVLPALSKLFRGLFLFAFFLFIIQVVFYDEGPVYFHLLPLGTGYVAVTETGVVIGVAMGFRMLSIITSFLVFLAATRTQDILNTLVEKLRVPGEMALMILTSIRFIPTFLRELKQISDAQRARAFVSEGWNPVRKVKAYLPIAVPLVLMSLQKAQHLVLAMETRGYGAGPRTHLRELALGGKDLIAVIGLVLILSGGILLRVKGYGVLA
ncbi:MAG TPA: energy-coupling factor transporter transmembrane component T [Verrucomicrobiae bacterium]|nr:energy-coupling factor transporter transmembrane component T [Verrucomicrobiae bacterium]